MKGPEDSTLESAFETAIDWVMRQPGQSPLSPLQARILESAKVVAWAYVGGMTQLGFLANRGLQTNDQEEDSDSDLESESESESEMESISEAEQEEKERRQQHKKSGRAKGSTKRRPQQSSTTGTTGAFPYNP